MGDRYGRPKDFSDAAWAKMTKVPRTTPYTPRLPARSMSGNRRRLAGAETAKIGTAKDETAVAPTTVIMIGETTPAATRAWPITSTPTMETAVPILRG